MLNEYSEVELPLINQLQLMGWQHVVGDIHVPYLTERQNFREVPAILNLGFHDIGIIAPRGVHNSS